MSGWDARTDGWDSGEEPEGPGESDDQGYQQSQPTGGYRTAKGGEGIVRAGRRGLPGYDQAQSYDQSANYDQYPAYGSAQGHRSSWSGVDDQQSYGTQAFGQHEHGGQGYAQQSGPGQDYPQGAIGRRGYEQQGYDQPGYGQQGYRQGYRQGYGQPGYGEQAPRQPGFGPGGSGAIGEPNQSYPGQGAQDYQTEAYPRQRFEQPGYAPEGYAQEGYAQNGGIQGGYVPDGYGQSGYGHDSFRQEAYGQGGYGPDPYGQPGFEQPAGQPYGDDDVTAPGRQPGSGQSRSGQRSPKGISGTRMIIYLVASVVGVVLIVLLAVRLTKSGTNSPASGSSTPSTGTSVTPGGTRLASGYVFTRAAKAGTLPLDVTATRDFAKVAESQAAPVAQEIRARGAGNPTKDVVAMYDLGPATSVSSGDFKAIGFVGYDGTFKPNAVIKFERTRLVSSHRVNAGPHGGQMICGYNTSSGSDASECVWVTTSTFGQVEFIVGQSPVKYPSASKLALEVRDAVEVPAG
jgi:hypothetical protein